MAIRKAILDTRFFFALYNPSSHAQEAWCKSVVLDSQKLSSQYSASCITIAELYENMSRLVGRDLVRMRISSIKNSGIEFIPLDEEISELAGDLKLNAGEIPMSDAIIAATARLFSYNRIFSDDPHFERIKKIKLIWTN